MLIRIVITLMIPALVSAEPAWRTLKTDNDFNNDWRVLSGNWEVDEYEGDIVGYASGNTMSWLASTRTYADFELELEFWTPTPVNGGVQIRSHWLPVIPVDEHFTRQMYGYQVNIDTTAKDGTCFIIDENGRGRLTGPSLDAQNAVKPDDWNSLRIVATGPVIETQINGVTANRLYDEKMLKGIIALQVMPGSKTGAAEIRFRNIKIKDLGRLGKWESLFDGKTLKGWKVWGQEEFTVEAGDIVGRSGPRKSEGYLATEKTWKDFRVRGQFKMLGEGNFGLFYHANITLREDGYPRIRGVQGEVATGWPSTTGWHYESYKRGWIIPPQPQTTAGYVQNPDDWNDIEIRAVGNHITSWVNGFQVTDFIDPGHQVFEGSLALQLHAGGVDGIRWKNIFIQSNDNLLTP